jgi:hypothetical protein
MRTQDESRSPATATASGTSPKLLQLLRKRIRQLLRIMLVLVVCLVLAAAALGIWWLRSLDGLPDISDPFDVAAFRGFSIPDDRNALAVLRRANQMLTVVAIDARVDDPRFRAWVEANRPAVELFLKASELTDGMSGASRDDASRGYPIEGEGAATLMEMTLVMGGMREEKGDMAGAWDCYRAVLRMTFLLRRRERLKDHVRDHTAFGFLRRRLATWAADPRTTVPQVRRALEEVVAFRPTEWDAFALKREYLDLMQFLDGPVDPPLEQIEEELAFRVGDLQVPAELALEVHRLRRLLLREPERSRRAIRLLFANWLAQAEGPEGQRRKPAVLVSFRGATRIDRVPLYPVGPEAPAGARVLSPHEVASWLVSAYDMKVVAWSRLWPSVRRREQAGYRELVVILARELYHRERGVLPPSEEALVGTYLESLPDDGSAENNDESTPTVPDERASAQPPAK